MVMRRVSKGLGSGGDGEEGHGWSTMGNASDGAGAGPKKGSDSHRAANKDQEPGSLYT